MESETTAQMFVEAGAALDRIREAYAIGRDYAAAIRIDHMRAELMTMTYPADPKPTDKKEQ